MNLFCLVLICFLGPFEDKDIYSLTLLLMDVINWMDFGEFLGLDHFIVHNIKQSYSWDSHRCIVEVLAEFVRRKDSPSCAYILYTLYYVMNMKQLARLVAEKWTNPG